MAGNASLAKEHEHPITSAKELYDWSNQKSNKNSSKMSFSWVSYEEYEQGVTEWSNIFKKSIIIAATQKYYSFVPISENKIQTKLFSKDDESFTYDVYKI